LNASRYHAEGPQAECEPGSRGRVLRNRLGIVRVRDIQQAESSALEAVQEWAIAHFGPHHCFDASDICQLHRRWLGDIYEWAGDYRAVNMTKDGFMFAAAGQVPRLMIEWERDTLRPATPCADMDPQRLAQALARTHAELVIIHPFREGNGRCARLLAWLMAMQAGWPTLDFGPMAGRGKTAYIAAIHAAFAGNYVPLETCFRAVMRRTSRLYGLQP
jgi:cell filamentation protein